MAYNLSELRRRVRRKLKDNSYNSGDIDDFINDSIQEIAEATHWSYLEKNVVGSLTVNEYTYEQQDDHDTTEKLILTDPTDASKYWVLTNNYLPHDEFFKRFPTPDSQDSTRPFYWTEYGDQLYFDRPADQAYKLRQFYYRLATDLSSDADVPDFPIKFRETIVLGATYRAEAQRRNFDISAVIENQFRDKLDSLIQKHAIKQLAAPEDLLINDRGHYEDW